MGDEIIVFVNKIVKIIHECTKRWDGKPTKNYGDKFLLTWRMPRQQDAIDLIKAEKHEESNIVDADEVKPEFAGLETLVDKKKSRRGTKVSPDLDSARDANDTAALLKDVNSDAVGGPNASEQDEDILFMGLTQLEIVDKRQEIADKAIIAAVKTIAELTRASDL